MWKLRFHAPVSSPSTSTLLVGTPSNCRPMPGSGDLRDQITRQREEVLGARGRIDHPHDHARADRRGTRGRDREALARDVLDLARLEATGEREAHVTGEAGAGASCGRPGHPRPESSCPRPSAARARRRRAARPGDPASRGAAGTRRSSPARFASSWSLHGSGSPRRNCNRGAIIPPTPAVDGHARRKFSIHEPITSVPGTRRSDTRVMVRVGSCTAVRTAERHSVKDGAHRGPVRAQGRA